MNTFSFLIVGVAFGKCDSYLKCLKFCDVHQEIDVRLGLTAKNNFFRVNENERKPYEHVSLEVLKSALKPFVCRHIQQGIDFMNDRNPLPDLDEVLLEELDNKHSDHFWTFTPGRHQIPRHELFREVEITAVEVENFSPPDFTLKISSIGPLSSQRFVYDLCNALNTIGTITRHVKTREGPFSLKDCLLPVDFHYKYVKEHLNHFTPIFQDYVKPHLDKISVFHDRRIW